MLLEPPEFIHNFDFFYNAPFKHIIYYHIIKKIFVVAESTFMDQPSFLLIFYLFSASEKCMREIVYGSTKTYTLIKSISKRDHYIYIQQTMLAHVRIKAVVKSSLGNHDNLFIPLSI